MKTKICSKCKQELKIINFNKDNKSKDKLFCYCRDCCKISHKEYYLKNKEELKKYYKNYYLRNKIKIEKQQMNYRKIRIHKDINYRILKNLRGRLFKALHGISKNESTIKLVGCSIEKLKKHLEKQFKEGMLWSNYGKWHIDHIRPCSSFDLSKPEEQHKCFNYMNLQPLWAKENSKKHTKLEIVT